MGHQRRRRLVERVPVQVRQRTPADRRAYKEYKKATKDEDHFNRQVMMNTRIKELEGLLEELVARL